MSSKIGIELYLDDHVSGPFKTTSAEISECLDDMDTGAKNVQEANRKMAEGTKDVVFGLSGLATSAFALYGGLERLEGAQFRADKANLAVQRSNQSLKDSQDAYNTAVEKYGPDSSQAADAANKLKIAQDALSLANERAEMTQKDVSNTIMAFGLSILPTAMTAIRSFGEVSSGVHLIMGNLHNATGLISGAMSFLAANPIVLVIAAVAALAAGLVWAYQNIKPFHDAINAVADLLMKIFKPAIDAVIGTVKWFADAVGSAWDWITGKTKDATDTIAADVSTLGYQVKDSFGELTDSIVGRSIYIDMWDRVVDYTKYGTSETSTSVTGLTTNVKASFMDMSASVKSVWGDTVKVFQEGGATIMDMRDKVTTATKQIGESFIIAADGAKYFVTDGLQKALAMGYEAQAKAWEDQRKAAAAKMAEEIAATEAMAAAWDMLHPRIVEEISGEEQRAIELGIPFIPAQQGFTGEIFKPTLFLAGEAGPERVEIGPSGKGGGITINGPLVTILGSADLTTIQSIRRAVEEAFKNVLVESSSSSAPTTHKRIRFGNVL